MSLSSPFIARPVATSLLAVAVLLAGALGYRALPVSALPQVDFPTITVLTQLPGASAETMSLLISSPLERQLGQITGLRSMSSLSAQSNSQITLQFTLARSLDGVSQDVQAAINTAAGTLPSNLPYPPTYAKVNPADAPIVSLALVSDTVPIDRVSDAADTLLQPRLAQIDGVGRVTVEGNMRSAVRVRVDPARLASYGLSMEDVRTAIANANVNGAKGGFDGARQAYALGANDQLLDAAAYRDLIVAVRNGNPVRLSALGGEVVPGLEDQHAAALYAGDDGKLHPAVLLDVQRQPGANIVGTAAAIREALPDIQRILPAGVRMVVASDRTQTIRASVRDVQTTLLIAMALVVAVIFVFLRTFRATLIPALALPLSLVGTFAVMSLAGFGLDNLSLMALTVATGFVVDDAIVVIENVVRHVEDGMAPMAASLRGASEIGWTIVSLTVSLVAVFIPLLFMEGVVGRLFGEFSITLSVAVLVSGVVSLTLTPMLCARLLRPASRTHETRFAKACARGFDRLLAAYARSLRAALRHQGLILALAVVSIFVTVGLYAAVPKGFLPRQDTGLIAIVTEAAQNVSTSRLADLQAQAATIAASDPAVASVASFVGAGGINATPNTGRLSLALKPVAQRASVDAVIARLMPKLGAISGLTSYAQPVQDIQLGTRVTRTQYQYTLVDTDPVELADGAGRLLTRLKTLPSLREVASDQQDRGFSVTVDIDRDAATRLGVTMQSVEDVLYDGFGQRQVSTIFGQSNQYRVILEATPDWQADPEALGRLRVPGTIASLGANGTTATSSATTSLTNTVGQVPIAAIAKIGRALTPLSVTREAQFPSVTISFNLAPGTSLGDAEAAIARASDAIGLPRGIAGHYGGDAAEFATSLAAEPWLILAAFVVIYIVLGVLYESFIHPLTILSTLPSAGIGALLALLLTGGELSLVSLVGIVLLMGIVKKNGILVVDFALDAERRGISSEEAIEQACLLRFRPILMTTAAALLGALPLALDQGTGAELRWPLGVTIVGGLLFSQLITLYTTPVVYLAFERLRQRRSRTALA